MKKLIALISTQRKSTKQIYLEVKKAIKKYNRIEKMVLNKITKEQSEQNEE